MLFIGIFSTKRCLSHFLQMYSLDVGIENLLDNASQTIALSKLYFDVLKMIHCDLGMSVFMTTCTQAAICQYSILGHIKDYREEKI